MPRTIPKSYTIRQIRWLHGEFKVSFGFMSDSVKAFLAWLEDREDRAEQEADRFFRRESKRWLLVSNHSHQGEMAVERLSWLCMRHLITTGEQYGEHGVTI